MADRLPWHVIETGAGCFLRDTAGNLIGQCFDTVDGEARDTAVAICWAVNRTGDPVCRHCGKPAACFGAYEDGNDPAYACNDCCGHGCEDGTCEQLCEDDDNG